MGIEQGAKKGWEPVLESQPSDLFVCNYGGPFAQQLELNRGVIERFLGIAALDGRLLLEEDKYRPPNTIPDLNPDGSVTGKGSLRWGEKPQVKEREGSNYYQVHMDQNGWTISINGELIMKELAEKNDGAGKINPKFARQLNGYFRDGLGTSLIKDKCTLKGDPFLIGRLMYLSTMIISFNNLIRGYDSVGIVLCAGLSAMANVITISKGTHSQIFRRAKELEDPRRVLSNVDFFPIWLISPFRRSTDGLLTNLFLPLEIDRLIGGLGYLEWLRIRRQSLVRLAR